MSVEHALYFEYLEILIACLFPATRKIRRIMIQYIKEIPLTSDTIKVGIKLDAEHYLFKMFTNECLHAAGELAF